MNKGKFNIKNHKKLVIERDGKELESKKNIQASKSAVKFNLVAHDENYAPLGQSKLHNKQEESLAHQYKRRSIFSHEKTQTSNVRKNAESTGKPEIFVRSMSKKMKSCYYEPQIQSGHSSIVFDGDIKQKSSKIRILIKSVYQLLRQNQWISDGKTECFSMKYDHFQSFLLGIMIVISLKRQRKVQKEIFTGFNTLINDIKSELCEQQEVKRRNSLGIDSNLIINQYSSSIYKKEEKNLLKNISSLSNEKEALDNLIANLKQTRDDLVTECNLKQEMLISIQKELSYLAPNKKKVQQEYLSISKSLSQAQALYSSLVEKEKDITDYVMNQQKNKIIKLVSEDYKLIEADIYQYASYLQSNLLATSLEYQPRPFDLIEKELMEEMKEVNRLIIREEESTMAEKAKLMRDFILKAVDKFKKKDEELGKLCEFKTKCIKKFVSQMQKWLNNWQLKQQYLVNLRKEFVLDASALKKKFDDLFSIQPHDSCPAGRDLNQRLDIVTLFNKIQENYKLGNSFY